MSSLSLRSFMAAALVSAIAVSGCSGSDSSAVKTRNGVAIQGCISASPSTVDATIEITISNPECATALVDVSPSYYTGNYSGTNTEPFSDRVDPVNSNFSFFHNSTDFDIAYEARIDDNIPVEYIRIKGDGVNPSSIEQSRSIITPESPKLSCLEINSSSQLISNCNNIDVVHETLYVMVNGEQRILYSHVTSNINAESVISTTAADVNTYYSAVAFSNGIPKNKVVLTRSPNEALFVTAYSYSAPTITKPFESLTTLSGPNEEVLPSVPTSNDQTIISPSSVAETSTTEALTTSQSPTQPIAEACAELQGVSTYPALSEWSESTRFQIDIENDCIDNVFGGGYSSVSLSSVIRATNSETGDESRFYSTSGENLKLAFSGRLYQGQWKLVIEQNTNFVTMENKIFEYNAVREIVVDIKADSKNPWKVCSSQDIQWDGEYLSLDCDYSHAVAHYLIPGFEDVEDTLGTEKKRPLPKLGEGWNPVTIQFENDGYKGTIAAILCAVDCASPPNGLTATASRNEDVIRIRPTFTECTSPDESMIGLHFVTTLNEYSKSLGSIRQTENGLLALNPSSDNIFLIPPGADHFVLYRTVDESRPECRSLANFSTSQWSLFSIPKSNNSMEDSEKLELTPPPASVDILEFSLTNSIGSSVIVGDNESVLEIPFTARPESSTNPQGNVDTMSVKVDDGPWIPLTSTLSTFVHISDTAKTLKVKYVFTDKSQSIITKPIVKKSDFEKKLAASSETSSNQLPLIALILLLLLVLAGSSIIIRRRK